MRGAARSRTTRIAAPRCSSERRCRRFEREPSEGAARQRVASEGGLGALHAVRQRSVGGPVVVPGRYAAQVVPRLTTPRCAVWTEGRHALPLPRRLFQCPGARRASRTDRSAVSPCHVEHASAMLPGGATTVRVPLLPTTDVETRFRSRKPLLSMKSTERSITVIAAVDHHLMRTGDRQTDLCLEALGVREDRFRRSGE